MPIFGMLGTALGGLIGSGKGAALASSLGGALGQRLDAKKAGPRGNPYKKMARQALAAGIHPLEALRSGGAQMYSGTGRMPIGSAIARTAAYDKFESILSGDAARDRARDKLDDDIARVNLDIARRRLSDLSTGGVGIYSGGVRSPSTRALPVGGEAYDKSPNVDERGVRVEPEGDLPATQTVTLGEQTARTPFSEAWETGLSELAAGAIIMGPQWLHGYAQGQTNDEGKDMSTVRRHLRTRRNAVAPPAPPPYRGRGDRRKGRK